LVVGLLSVLAVTVGLAGSVFHLDGAVDAMNPRGGLDENARVRARHTQALAAARAVAAARAAQASRVMRVKPSRDTEERAADTSHAAALFATHSWYVPPPPPPPVAPPPPAAPEAPPFPYTFVGSYAPAGEQPVYFLSRADRVIDAHIGDRLDGVYDFESAESGSLVFKYLPLNIRQSVPTGVSP
jgi:hypothetical protein